MNQTFDVVVVGGGSAGAAVSARLSEDPGTSVCLIEAGGSGDSWLNRIPIAVAAVLPSRHGNWHYETEPQPGLSGRRGYQPRGKGLGGSSAINVMVYVRGHPSDYDHWAEQGNPGWAYTDVLPYFLRSEDNEEFAEPWHGRGGPLTVSKGRHEHRLNGLWLQACAANGVPTNDDCNGAEQSGACLWQVTQRNGERCSSARAYLGPARPATCGC